VAQNPRKSQFPIIPFPRSWDADVRNSCNVNQSMRFFHTMLATGLSDFAAEHWLAGGIASSLVWFVAGLSNRNPNAAIGWQCVAVLTVLIVCGWAIVEGQWLGLVAAMGVLYLEVRSIRRTSASQGPQA
jgi:hypothetical protein